MNMNIKFNTTEDLIIIFQSLKGKTKLHFYQKNSKYYDQMK